MPDNSELSDRSIKLKFLMSQRRLALFFCQTFMTKKG
jgi:hypothetical protein